MNILAIGLALIVAVILALFAGAAKADQVATDTVMAGVGSKTTYVGAGGISLSWLFTSEFGFVFGAFVALAGLVMNMYYSRKRDRREQAHERRLQEEHELRMQALRLDVPDGK